MAKKQSKKTVVHPVDGKTINIIGWVIIAMVVVGALSYYMGMRKMMTAKIQVKTDFGIDSSQMYNK